MNKGFLSLKQLCSVPNQYAGCLFTRNEPFCRRSRQPVHFQVRLLVVTSWFEPGTDATEIPKDNTALFILFGIHSQFCKWQLSHMFAASLIFPQNVLEYRYVEMQTGYI